MSSIDGVELLRKNAERLIREADLDFFESKEGKIVQNIARSTCELAAEKFNAADKLIVMGTGGKNPLADAGLALIGCIKLFCGKKHISKLIDSMAFGTYNKGFEDENIEKNYAAKDYHKVYIGEILKVYAK